MGIREMFYSQYEAPDRILQSCTEPFFRSRSDLHIQSDSRLTSRFYFTI